MILGSNSAANVIPNKNNIGVAFGGAEPCVPEVWNQTDGTGEVAFNTNFRSAANNVSAGNADIGKTITSFKMELKVSSAGTDVPLYFGVWASGNVNLTTPTTAFTGTIDNYNDLSTSYVWYTFTGSHTLAEDDHIGFAFNAQAPNIRIQRAASSGEVTIDDCSFTLLVASSPTAWVNYNAAQVLNMEAFQTC